MTLQMEARNAELPDLVELLRKQHAQKLDVIAPATQFRGEEGLLRVSGAEQAITEDGVSTVDGLYRPTRVFDEGMADKLGIPLAYVRKLRAERPDLWDANVNGWLHGRQAAVLNPRRDAEGVYRWDDGTVAERGEQRFRREAVPPDRRKFLLRLFSDPDGGPGVARAMLSDSYKVMDNLDVLTAALQGMQRAGVAAEIEACDLTDRRMYVRVVAPEIRALAPALLARYRDPFGDELIRGHDVAFWREMAAREGKGYAAGEEPVVFAGYVLANSEVGGGALTLTPRIVVQICRNGLTVTRDALRRVHLGAQLEEGVISWSDTTQEKNLALVTSMTADAVATFLDTGYVEKIVAEVEEKAGKPVGPDAIEKVGKKLAFDQATLDGVMEMFVRGGDLSAGGVMQAVTAHAQRLPDADKASALEDSGLRALEFAAAL
jgi:hypothetical protein